MRITDNGVAFENKDFPHYICPDCYADAKIPKEYIYGGAEFDTKCEECGNPLYVRVSIEQGNIISSTIVSEAKEASVSEKYKEINEDAVKKYGIASETDEESEAMFEGGWADTTTEFDMLAGRKRYTKV